MRLINFNQLKLLIACFFISFILYLILSLSAYYSLYGGKSAHMEPIFSELNEEWRSDLDAKRQAVSRFVFTHYQASLSGTSKDFAILQRILDDHLIPNSDLVFLQALGVVFGDVVADEIDADWKLVYDKFGESPVLKVRYKRMAIGALTIISKRIEDKQDVNINQLYQDLVENVGRIRLEADTDGH